MVNSARLLSLLAILLFVGLPKAIALDCSKASVRQEIDICNDARAKASDSEMEAAFEQCHAGLVGEARQSLLYDQRDWLNNRNTTCANKQKLRDAAADAEVQCIREMNRSRANILLGRPEAGAGLIKAPMPFFVRQAGGRHRFDVKIRVYRFDSPKNAGEFYINKEADLAVKNTPKYDEDFGDDHMSYEISWVPSYGSNRLLSISVERWEASGGAHGSFDRSGINIDISRGQQLDLKKIFDSSAMKRISQVCFDEVNRNDNATGDYPYHPGYEEGDTAYTELFTSIDKEVKDPSRWIFSKYGATISLGYLLTYASGYYDCNISFSVLDSLSMRAYR